MKTLNNLKMKIMVRAFRIRIKDGENFEDIAADYPALTVDDLEAIKAELPGLGCAGYVANSPHTVLGDCISAGRLYDKIGDSATAKVVYVLDNAVVCKVKIREKEKMCGQCIE